MNLLADRVLLSAYARQVRSVPPGLVKENAESLASLHFGARG